MEESNLPLCVSIHKLEDYINCSICMNELTSTTMTMCGHRYCQKCILEWVDRKHTCPCCNANLTQKSLFKDHQYDSLIATINTEKQKEEEKYFETLINSVSHNETSDVQLSPVEKVLQNHLKRSLAAHEKYLQNLRDQFHKKITSLDRECTKAISELQMHSLSQQEVTQQTSDLNNTLSRRKEALQEELNICAKLIADAFDKHLESHIPRLDVLPVKVSINILDKNIQLSDLMMSPADVAVSRIKTAVEEAMKAKGNPLVAWEDDVQFVLFGPFVKCSPCEMQQMIREILYNGLEYPDIHVLANDCRPVLQLGMKPNSVIVIYGTLRCESDLPKRCFVKNFRKEEGQTMDYFQCKQCSFKWICRSCMEVCHRGHDVVPYIMNHVPEWACCYCPRKKKCVL
ncbi:E3 ubiquitin-protein ligase TRIM38-like [Ostrea edulis]|uniref:E3 ubiquitin-protein ligase TRIM38-like n=1 Tax=Ostrea edulis TaxID=37623 RepID=UPI0024AED0E4|nr:E3 ubiquitin-protein ligase TRIM38-like [Ostrea edulis]